jgi:NAD(P)-dependent dehydrogenase (short-subunit alcohol dehydrogenase family)
VNTYQVAVEDYAAVEKAVAQVVDDFGRLDVMIANAGIPTKAGGLDDKVEDWNRVRAIDFDGAYYCARAAGLVFRKQGCKSPTHSLTLQLELTCIYRRQLHLHSLHVRPRRQRPPRADLLQRMQSRRHSSH